MRTLTIAEWAGLVDRALGSGDSVNEYKSQPWQSGFPFGFFFFFIYFTIVLFGQSRVPCGPSLWYNTTVRSIPAVEKDIAINLSLRKEISKIKS